MAKNKALEDKLKELDFFYGEKWEKLPNDHPDIIAMKKVAKKVSNPRSGIRISKYSPDGEFLEEYPNIKIAAAKNGLRSVVLAKASKSEELFKGYIWKRIPRE